jgi:uncharacterized protein YkwD
MPRRARTLVCVAILAAALAASSPAPVATAGPHAPTPAAAAVNLQLEHTLLRLINDTRAERGLRSLRASRTLARTATGHARSMAQFGYFAHASRDGSSPRDRIARADPRLAARGVGEVLLWRSPGPSPDQALAMWLASPPHRAVLLDPRLRLIGLVALDAHAAPGVFGGRDVTIVAADLSG